MARILAHQKSQFLMPQSSSPQRTKLVQTPFKEWWLLARENTPKLIRPDMFLEGYDWTEYDERYSRKEKVAMEVLRVDFQTETGVETSVVQFGMMFKEFVDPEDYETIRPITVIHTYNGVRRGVRRRCVIFPNRGD